MIIPIKKDMKQIKCGGLFRVKPQLQLQQKHKDLGILSRIDYVLCNQALSITKDARIVHGYTNGDNEFIEMDEVSDHYPVIIQFTTKDLSYKSSTSDIIFDSSFVSPQNMLGSNYLATDLVIVFDNYGNGNFYDLTKENAVKIASFKVRDRGNNGDDDNFPTILNNINFKISNYHVLDKDCNLS